MKKDRATCHRCGNEFPKMAVNSDSICAQCEENTIQEFVNSLKLEQEILKNDLNALLYEKIEIRREIIVSILSGLIIVMSGTIVCLLLFG
jgi:predicted amidophosphoribosyltransferase